MKLHLSPFFLAFFFLAIVNAPTANAEKITIERDVEYGHPGNVSLKLDVFRPAKTDPAEKNETERKGEANIKKPRPAVIYVHGGAWKYGDKIEGVPFLTFLAASGDYVGFSINYRLTDGTVRWPDPLYDCKAAVRFVRLNAKRFGVDPERIGVSGTSAGGHLVNMLGMTCDEPEFEGESGTPGVSTGVRCVINNCGPTDLPNLGFTDPKDWEILKSLLGATPSENPALYKAASPIYYMKGIGARDQGLGARDQGQQKSPLPLAGTTKWSGPGVRADWLIFA
jgi:acetyl esterase/lipase